MMLCALIMDLRKTFTFDATHHIVRWMGRTVLKAELGEIPFDHITDIGTEDTRRKGGRPSLSPHDHHPASHNPHGLRRRGKCNNNRRSFDSASLKMRSSFFVVRGSRA